MGLSPRIVGSGGSPSIPLPRRNSAGAGIAQGVSELADAAENALDQRQRTDRAVDNIDHQIAVDRQRDDDAALFAKQSAQWAVASSRMSEKLAEARQQAKSGGEGHAERASEIIREEQAEFDQGFAGNHNVRERFFASMSSTVARFETREKLWASDQAAKASGENTELFLSASSNDLRLDASSANYSEKMGQLQELADAFPLNDDAKAAIAAKGGEQLSLAYAEGMISEGRLDEVDALVKSGFFNDKVSDIGGITKRLRIERRALSIEQRSAQRQLEDDAKEMLGTIEAKIKAGINPTEADFATARNAALQAGLPKADIIEADSFRIQTGLNQQFPAGVSPEKIRPMLEELQAKIANGEASETEQVAGKHLQDLFDARQKELSDKLKPELKNGAGGRMKILQQLPRDPAARFAQAEKVERGLGHVSLLPEVTQQVALEGREVRKARPKEFGEKDQIRRVFAQAVGGFGSTLAGDYDDILNLAWDTYAGEENSRGRTGFDSGRFKTMVSVVMGRTKRPDGKHQGGMEAVRGKQVLLPHNKTADEFDRLLSRATFADARYADGSAVQKADILERYRPSYVGDNEKGAPVYHFIDPSGAKLKTKSGVDYPFVVVR